MTLRFIFPNKDGLNVTVDCKPTDTVGEVKGMLLSMWPDGKFALVDGIVVLKVGALFVSFHMISLVSDMTAHDFLTDNFRMNPQLLPSPPNQNWTRAPVATASV